MKEMEKIKQFTKSTKRKVEGFEMALLNIPGKSSLTCNENSPLLLEPLENRIFSLEKELIEKDAFISFLLKHKIEPDISSVIYAAEKIVTDDPTVTDETAENTVPETVQKIETEKAKSRTRSKQKKGNSSKTKQSFE